MPFLALNTVAEPNRWTYGHDLSERQDVALVEIWFLDHQSLSAQSRAPKKRSNQTSRLQSPPAPPPVLSTPNDTGAGVRVLGAHPFLTNKQVVDIMLRSATDLGAEGTDAI